MNYYIYDYLSLSLYYPPQKIKKIASKSTQTSCANSVHPHKAQLLLRIAITTSYRGTGPAPRTVYMSLQAPDVSRFCEQRMWNVYISGTVLVRFLILKSLAAVPSFTGTWINNPSLTLPALGELSPLGTWAKSGLYGDTGSLHPKIQTL